MDYDCVMTEEPHNEHGAQPPPPSRNGYWCFQDRKLHFYRYGEGLIRPVKEDPKEPRKAHERTNDSPG